MPIHASMKLSLLRPFSKVSVIVLIALGVLTPNAARATLRCEMLPSFFHSYLQHHVRFRTMTPEIEQRTIDTYLRRLDPGRSLLTQKEYDAMTSDMNGIFAKIPFMSLVLASYSFWVSRLRPGSSRRR